MDTALERTVSLPTIFCHSLISNSSLEIRALFDACRSSGFFYLDMRSTHPDFTSVVSEIYALSRQLFDLPINELLAYDVDTLSPLKLSGYKPLGRNRAGLAGGKDGFETYAIPKDGVLGLDVSNWRQPALVDQYLGALRMYCEAITNAAQSILSALSIILDVPPGNLRLEDLHRSTEVRSPDLVRLLKYHTLKPNERGEGVAHIAHTDLGSLTFLCTQQWGLQVQHRTRGWEWVPPPLPGHVIVNLGDMLSLLTAGYLKSCLHRVVPVPGQEGEERYSFVYLLRAEGNAKLRAVKSPLIDAENPTSDRATNDEGTEQRDEEEKEPPTSEEWLKRKFTLLRGKTWSEEKSWILTGVREVER